MIFLLDFYILNIVVLLFQVFEINESLYVVELKKSSGDCSLYRKVVASLDHCALERIDFSLAISYLANI